MTYDYSRLTNTQHMLEWLHPEPIDQIKEIFTDYVVEMVPGSKLLSLSVNSNPQWLTGGKPQPTDESKIVLTRTGVAFLFSLQVQPPNKARETVTGVFTWAGVKLDDQPNTKQKTWIDVAGTLEEFGAEGELKVRIYALQTDE